MQKTIHIHIGTHKTGTTAIQKFSKENKEYLEKFDTYYPLTSIPYDNNYNLAHHLIPWILKKHNVPEEFFGPYLDEKNLMKDLIKEISNSKSNNILISSEEFDRLSYEEIKRLKEYFVAFKIIIYIYLRNKDELIESMYQTNVLHHNEYRNLNEIFNHVGVPVNYYEFISKWQNIFGKSDVIIKNYSGKLLENNIVVNFFNDLNIDVINLIDSKKSKTINKSIDYSSIVLLAIMRKNKVPKNIENLFIQFIYYNNSNEQKKYSIISKQLRKDLVLSSNEEIKKLGLDIEFINKEEKYEYDNYKKIIILYSFIKKFEENLISKNQMNNDFQVFFENILFYILDFENIKMDLYLFNQLINYFPLNSIQKIINADNNNYINLNLMALCFEKEKNYREAFQYWEKSFQIDKTKIWTITGLFNNLLNLNKHTYLTEIYNSLDIALQKNLHIVLQYAKSAINVHDFILANYLYTSISDYTITYLTDIIKLVDTKKSAKYNKIGLDEVKYISKVEEKTIHSLGYYQMKEFSISNNCYYLQEKKIYINEDIAPYHQIRAFLDGNSEAYNSLNNKESYVEGTGIIFITSNNGYGHWLLDLFPKLFLMYKNVNDIFSSSKLILSTDTPSWAIAFIQMFFEVNDKNFYFYDRKTQKVKVEQAFIPTILHCRYSFHPYMNEFIDFIVEKNNLEKELASFEKLYISRRKVESRILPNRIMSNEEEIESYLSTQGYKIIYNEELSWKEKIFLYSNAKIIIGTFGSGMLNTMFAKQKTKILSIRPFNETQTSISMLRDHILYQVNPDTEEYIDKNTINYKLEIKTLNIYIEKMNKVD